MPRHFSSLHVIAPNAISEHSGRSYMQLESDIDVCQFRKYTRKKSYHTSQSRNDHHSLLKMRSKIEQGEKKRQVKAVKRLWTQTPSMKPIEVPIYPCNHACMLICSVITRHPPLRRSRATSAALVQRRDSGMFLWPEVQYQRGQGQAWG